MVHARPEYRPGAGRRAERAFNLPMAMTRSGLLRPWRPIRTARQVAALRRWGTTLAGELVSTARRDPNRPALVDEHGTLTYAELDRRTDRLATALIAERHGPRPRVGVLCRNHRGMVEALVACGKRGAEVVLLNTGLGPGQLHAVLSELWADLLIVDSEFMPLLPPGLRRVSRVTAWVDGTAGDGPSLNELIETAPDEPPEPPWVQGRTVFLSSGTTGRPKGARRRPRPGVMPLTSMLSRIPLRVGQTMLIEAPLFHTWGYAALQIAFALRATVVLRRRFDGEATLAALAEHRCAALFAVPVMVQRLMEVPTSVRAGHDLSSLKLAAVSGSRLPGRLAVDFMDAFDAGLYNVYGSTEASWVTIATPRDLRAYPDTAGRPPGGTQIAILDERGEPVRPGATGRIFAANELLFEGYTTGPPLERRDGLLSTGDVGHLDAEGLLFIDGRTDDMIVSGGENVFPHEVEDILARLPQVREVAVIGVPDATYGKRPAAYVVLDPGAELSADEVRDHVRDRLARYAVPRDVYFIDELPRNATGKVVPRLLHETAPEDPPATTSV